MAILKIIKTEIKEEVLAEFGINNNFDEVKKKLEELREKYQTKNCKIDIKLIDGYYSNK